MKENLKQSFIERNGRDCFYCGLPIDGDFVDMDTDRIIPKAQGGSYAEKNYRIAHPACHMKRHGTYRERPKLLDELKALVDDREQIMKTFHKINNQMLAYRRRTDFLNPETLEFLSIETSRLKEVLGERSRDLKKLIKEIVATDKLAKAAMGVKGIGPVTVAYCLNYIRLEKARHASSLWSYAGLDKPSHKRYEKNISGGGNKSLRKQLFTMADSQMKGRNKGSAYGDIYDKAKAKKEQSLAMVKSRTRQGQLIETMWRDAMPSHRHAHALRMIMKHFLADYWFVGRTISGLPTDPLYAESVLKDGHRTIMPEERGWKY